MAKQIATILQSAAQGLVKDIEQAARQEGFTSFVDLPETVRLRCLGSLIDLTKQYCQALQKTKQVDPENFWPGSILLRSDFLQQYAETEVQRHRGLAIDLSDFLTLLMQYRQAFLRVLEQHDAQDKADLVTAMFDALNIACAEAWARQSREQHGDRIRQREAFWRKTFAVMNDAVIIHEAQTGQAIFVNAAAERMYGADKKTMLEAPLGQFNAGSIADKQKMLAKLQEATKRGAETGPQHFEWQAKHNDGHVFWVDISLSYIKNADGEYVVAIIRNIDANKRAEQQKQQVHNKEQEMQHLESLGLLAGGIAHDFNNLLTSIMGNAELLRLGDVNDEDSLCLNSIEDASEKAANLCQQMLHFSGTGLVNKMAVSLSSIVYDTVDRMRQESETDISIVVNIEDALPDIIIGREQLAQVLINLLLNAMESVLEPEQTKIVVSAGIYHCDANCPHAHNMTQGDLHIEHRSDDYLRIEVADNGCGMLPEVQEKIFEPFFSTKFFGRGLGLAAVAGIARSYKGFVKVESEKSVGSTISLFLPLDEIAPQYRSEDKPANTILLVDDDFEVRSVGERMLKLMNFTVLLADNGETGLKIFKAEQAHICCVLTDLSMPKLDGIELARRIGELKSQLPIIVMSGYDVSRAAQHIAHEMPVQYMQKPFNFNKLKDVLRKATDRKIE